MLMSCDVADNLLIIRSAPNLLERDFDVDAANKV
jgi:hypothetical protein